LADKIFVSNRDKKFKAESQIVLSLFHGIDLFGRGFEKENFCVVRAGEIDLGFDCRDLHLPPGRFDGIIAGTPCQQFSIANRTRRHQKDNLNCVCPGCQMLKEFTRLITEAQPEWFILENVPQVPNVIIPGYKIQRFDLNAKECGLKQNRLRHFQFGSLDGRQLILHRAESQTDFEPCAMASEGKRQTRRSITKFLQLQGLPEDLELPYFKKVQQYKVIGQGVPVPMARMIAKAIRDSSANHSSTANHRVCICNCGRIVTGKAKHANAACRKRMQLRRESAFQHNL
jgi:DNA (cytosine-5)-methyltransferase 1